MKKMYGTTKKEWDNCRRKENRIDGKQRDGDNNDATNYYRTREYFALVASDRLLLHRGKKTTSITIKIRSGKRFFFSRKKIAAARRKTMFACKPNQLMLEDRTCLQEKVGVLSALNVNLHACKLILVQLLLDTHSELRCEFTACDICIAPPIVFTR
jgi:hypothetical protein